MVEFTFTIRLNVVKLLNGFVGGVLASIFATIICKYLLRL